MRHGQRWPRRQLVRRRVHRKDSLGNDAKAGADLGSVYLILSAYGTLVGGQDDNRLLFGS